MKVVKVWHSLNILTILLYMLIAIISEIKAVLSHTFSCSVASKYLQLVKNGDFGINSSFSALHKNGNNSPII